jgi:hypothetical protein
MTKHRPTYVEELLVQILETLTASTAKPETARSVNRPAPPFPGDTSPNGKVYAARYAYLMACQVVRNAEAALHEATENAAEAERALIDARAEVTTELDKLKMGYL